MAINIFIAQFELRHLVTVYHCELAQEETIQEGSYYCSGIIRLNFGYRKANTLVNSSVILKIPRLATLENYGRRMFLFEKGRYVYDRLFPLMYESWSRERLTPELYGCTDSNVLVLENLRESKFYTQERGTLLGLSGCLLALKLFAQFHALSVKHVNRVKTELDAMTASDRDEGEWARKIYPPILKIIQETIIPRCSAPARDKFRDYVRNLSTIIKLGYSPQNALEFGVIMHGDAHYHNVLFQDDHRTFDVTQCKLVDFQSCRVGSPVIDIMSFLVTSVEYVFEKNSATLFSTYLREFDDTMKVLDPSWLNPYGLRELLDDVERYKLFFLYYFTTNIPCFWAGQLYPSSLEVDRNNIDAVLKSEKFIS